MPRTEHSGNQEFGPLTPPSGKRWRRRRYGWCDIQNTTITTICFTYRCELGTITITSAQTCHLKQVIWAIIQQINLETIRCGIENKSGTQINLMKCQGEPNWLLWRFDCLPSQNLLLKQSSCQTRGVWNKEWKVVWAEYEIREKLKIRSDWFNLMDGFCDTTCYFFYFLSGQFDMTYQMLSPSIQYLNTKWDIGNKYMMTYMRRNVKVEGKRFGLSWVALVNLPFCVVSVD